MAKSKSKKSGDYSPKLMKAWNPKEGTAAFKIGECIEKGMTVAETIKKTGIKRNTVVARYSDYRRIHELAHTGKVYDKETGKLVDKPKAAKVPDKKKTAKPKSKKKVKAAKPKQQYANDMTGKVSGIPTKTIVVNIPPDKEEKPEY